MCRQTVRMVRQPLEATTWLSPGVRRLPLRLLKQNSNRTSRACEHQRGQWFDVEADYWIGQLSETCDSTHTVGHKIFRIEQRDSLRQQSAAKLGVVALTQKTAEHTFAKQRHAFVETVRKVFLVSAMNASLGFQFECEFIPQRDRRMARRHLPG